MTSLCCQNYRSAGEYEEGLAQGAVVPLSQFPLPAVFNMDETFSETTDDNESENPI